MKWVRQNNWDQVRPGGTSPNAGGWLVLLAATTVLAGCNLAPKYARPASPVAGQYPGVTRASESHSAALAWKTVISEDRLKRLIEIALVNNRDLRVAALKVEQSRAEYRIARSAIFPNAAGNASYTRAHAAGMTGDTWSASLGSTAYEVDLWGRVRSLNHQALEKYLATEEARRSAQITLIAEVASQYFQAREAGEQILLARRTLSTVEESRKLNQASSDIGEINEQDLRTAEAQVETAKLNLLTYERALTTAENALVLLIGQGLPSDLPAPQPFNSPHLVADVPADLPAELAQRRPDILEAEHTLKAANANIGAARAAFFPSIKLTGSLGTTSSQLYQLFGAGTGVWSFSPQISIPIFTGGQNRADLDSAKLGARIEIATYEKAIQTAFREVADALVDTTSYASQIEARQRLIVAQQARFDLATLRYRAGDDSYLNVLSAQQDLYSAQQGLIQAQANRIVSQIALYKALGGGWK
jgi:outer membrane protein, multidrug efflux system